MHIPALDGLRGIAILLVLGTHLLPHRSGASIPLRMINGVAGIGWSGVDIFFVLSGFLITGILFDSKSDPRYFRNFYMRRTLRIAPLYFLLVFLCTTVFSHFSATPGSSPNAYRWMFWVYLSNIVETFHGHTYFGWLGPLWSLAVEEHFYLIWPAVILFCTRRAAIQVCLGCVLLANCVRMVFLMHDNLLGPYVFTFSRIDELALGALVALTLRGDSNLTEVRALATQVLVIAGTITAGLFVWRHGVILDPIMLGIGLPAVGALSTAALTLAVLPGTALSWKAFLEIPVLRQFGRYSYGLYLLHMPVSEILHLHKLVLQGQSHAVDVLNMMMVIAASFALAALSFHCFEKPFLRLKKFFEPGYSRPPAVKRGDIQQASVAGGLPMKAQL